MKSLLAALLRVGMEGLVPSIRKWPEATSVCVDRDMEGMTAPWTLMNVHKVCIMNYITKFR